MELIYEIGWPVVKQVCLPINIGILLAVAFSEAELHAVWMQKEHKGGFHLAGVTAAAEAGLAHSIDAVGGEVPIRGKNEFYFWKIGFELTQKSAERDVVSPVAIEEKNFLAAELYDGMAKFADELNIRHLTDAECAGEKKVMRGVPGPECGQAKNFIGALLLDAARDGVDNVGVGREWEVRAVLLKRAKRKNDYFVGEFESFDFGPR